MNRYEHTINKNNAKTSLELKHEPPTLKYTLNHVKININIYLTNRFINVFILFGYKTIFILVSKLNPNTWVKLPSQIPAYFFPDFFLNS